MTIQVKATEQYFPVVLFIMLHMMVLTFKSLCEILKCDHSNKATRIDQCIPVIFLFCFVLFNFLFQPRVLLRVKHLKQVSTSVLA